MQRGQPTVTCRTLLMHGSSAAVGSTAVGSAPSAAAPSAAPARGSTTRRLAAPSGPFGALCGGGQGSFPLMMIMIFVVFYFMLDPSRSRRSRRSRQDWLKSLKKGDEVVTSGGLIGRISGLTDNTVTLEVQEKVRVKVLRSHVAGKAPGAAASRARTTTTETRKEVTRPHGPFLGLPRHHLLAAHRRRAGRAHAVGRRPGSARTTQLPGWCKKHVQKKILLGLDLQGGLHLVYEVQVDKAVSDKADRLASDLEEKLHKDKKVKDVRAERVGQRRDHRRPSRTPATPRSSTASS